MIAREARLVYTPTQHREGQQIYCSTNNEDCPITFSRHCRPDKGRDDVYQAGSCARQAHLCRLTVGWTELEYDQDVRDHHAASAEPE